MKHASIASAGGLVALMALAVPLAGQADSTAAAGGTASVTGLVVDQNTGRPLPDAVVVLLGSGAGAVTDSAGRFRVPSTAAGPDTVMVRLIGYGESKLAIDLQPGATTDVSLLLGRQVLRLADLQVTVERETPRLRRLSDFERRRARGFGHFVTPDIIERRNPQTASDLLRSVPGLSVSRSIMGRSTVQLTRGSLDCEPMFYLDGQPRPSLHIDDLNPHDVIAIEVYRGPSEVPAELAYRGGCGLIIIWTRGGEPNG